MGWATRQRGINQRWNQPEEQRTEPVKSFKTGYSPALQQSCFVPHFPVEILYRVYFWVRFGAQMHQRGLGGGRIPLETCTSRLACLGPRLPEAKGKGGTASSFGDGWINEWIRNGRNGKMATWSEEVKRWICKTIYFERFPHTCMIDWRQHWQHTKLRSWEGHQWWRRSMTRSGEF